MQDSKKGKEAKLILNIDNMNLSALQKKRLIFLLGPRYKNSSVFKIVYRNYDSYEKNLLKAFELLKLVYIEAKRAPIFHPFRSTPRERKVYYRNYFGKTKDARDKGIKAMNELYNKEIIQFRKLLENKNENFNEDEINERIEKRLKTQKLNQEKIDLHISSDQKEAILEDLGITKKEIEEKIIENKKLTPRAFKLFFKNEQSEN